LGWILRRNEASDDDGGIHPFLLKLLVGRRVGGGEWKIARALMDIEK